MVSDSNKEFIKKLPAPNSLKNIWPTQSCPAFIPRENCSNKLKECWYCQHADFHLDQEVALDVGVCYWPKVIMK